MRLEAMGCEPLAASGTDEAFALALARRPHMILLDLKLNEGTGASGFEGVQLLGRLREHAETAAIPVVIHSIFVRHPAEAPAPLPRVEGFLYTPFKFDELREHAETAAIPVVIHSIFVRHPAEAPSPMPRVDGFLFKPFKFDELRELVDQHRPPGDD